MRTVRVQWSQPITVEGGVLHVETEVLIDSDEDAKDAGREAWHVLMEVVAGASDAGDEILQAMGK